jgi:hypothetical protein
LATCSNNASRFSTSAAPEVQPHGWQTPDNS